MGKYIVSLMLAFASGGVDLFSSFVVCCKCGGLTYS